MPEMSDRERAALAVSCPRCGAAEGELCHRLCCMGTPLPNPALNDPKLRLACHPQRHAARLGDGTRAADGELSSRDLSAPFV